MGDFLQQGMNVMAINVIVTLLHKIQPFIQCKPIVPWTTLYWLEASTTNIEAQFLHSPTIYKVDYDLMHRRLGHPAKDILKTY